MSSTRLVYDNCELNQSDIQRVDSMNYHLFTHKYSHFNFCNYINGSGICHLDDSKKIDVENDLYQLNTKSSKCDVNKYSPPCKTPTNCPLPNNNFTPVRYYERNVIWTNLKKPDGNGLPKI